MTPRPWLLFLPLNHESVCRSGPECPQGFDQGESIPPSESQAGLSTQNSMACCFCCCFCSPPPWVPLSNLEPANPALWVLASPTSGPSLQHPRTSPDPQDSSNGHRRSSGTESRGWLGITRVLGGHSCPVAGPNPGSVQVRGPFSPPPPLAPPHLLPLLFLKGPTGANAVCASWEPLATSPLLAPGVFMEEGQLRDRGIGGGRNE